ncbi:hypothetical protein J2Y74_003200 [Pseudomonas migulae]|uniref:hypothetical protein n=1 Tax=Pseudomonas migulae TaxID=78543 RepID=UPI0020A024CA|nr:hypothetical protein [Pseudomonas migulae]MCP1518890.1 hypothetical protein [Pseudomonas migulae]
MTEYPFPWPNETKGYTLFPSDLEDDQLVLFHGTSIDNFEAIINDGFKSGKSIGNGTDPVNLLGSVSYAKRSNQSLSHVCSARDLHKGGVFVVFATRFDSIDSPYIANNAIDIHVLDPNIQPSIICYCIIPENYKFI